jgi:hypothetical protein
MTVGTATTPADGIVPGIAPSAPLSVGTGNTAGTGGAREAKQWLVAQGHQPARTLPGNLRSALPGTTIIAAIHDRTLDHLPVPADVTVRLAAGRVLQVT